jgi:hypothetical protein
LSGSSLCCTAQWLSEKGIPDERIVFFPSWEPDGGNFVSAAARDRWRKHRKFTVDLDRVWIESGRLTKEIPSGSLENISAGLWRDVIYRSAAHYPPVHPQHERRKFLCRTGIPAGALAEEGNGSSLSRTEPFNKDFRSPGDHDGKGPSYFIKFAGLGRFGRRTLKRAQKLAEAGFAPPVVRFENGFIIYEFVMGRPLSRFDADQSLLDWSAAYLTFIAKNFPTLRGASEEELIEMIRVNVREGLGEEWLNKLQSIHEWCPKLLGESAVGIDGRLMPHEWLRSGANILKTDGTDHHVDHFIPGSQDIAWDVAGFCVEFGLSAKKRDYFLKRFEALSGETGVRKRLPFFTLAYVSYRLGYSVFSANSLGDSPDGKRFGRYGRRYGALLKLAIRKLSV